MKYYFSAEMAPTGLKQALLKVKDVEKVELDEVEHTAKIVYTGKCGKLGALELAAHNSGIPALILNHAHVMVQFAAIKGQVADPAKAKAELATIEGVGGIDVVAGSYELHCDLTKVTKTAIEEAAKAGNCEAIINTTYEFVSYKVVSGEAADYAKEMSAKKGVMMVKQGDEGLVSMWIKKAYITNLKKDLETVNGIKVEKQ